jgi:hypothetical protein
MTMAMPHRAPPRAGLDVPRRAAIEDLAPSRRMTGNDAGERRLARAIRAEERWVTPGRKVRLAPDERALR